MGDIVSESLASDLNHTTIADSLQFSEAAIGCRQEKGISSLKLRRRQNFYRKFNTYRKRRKTITKISEQSVSKPVGVALVGKAVYRCPHCRFWARTENRFHIHFMEHKKIPLFQCSDCRFTGFHRQNIWKHIHQVSTVDGLHKRSTCRMLSITPTENYSTYLQVTQVPPTAYSGLLPTETEHISGLVTPPNKVNNMTNEVKSAEAVEMTAEPTVPETSTSTLSNKEQLSNNPVSVDSNNGTAVLDPVSRTSLGKEENKLKRKRDDSISDKSMKKKEKKEDGILENVNPQVLLEQRLKLKEEKEKVEAEIKNKHGELDVIKSNLENAMKTWMEQKDKIKSFEKEKGDALDQLKLACLQAEKEKTREKINNFKNRKLLQEMSLRLQQTDNLRIQVKLIELDETDEEYSELEKKLAQGDEKVVIFENATKEISADISKLEREEKEFDCQVNAMEVVMTEFSDMEKGAKPLETQCLGLIKKRDCMVSDIEKLIRQEGSLQLAYVKVLYEESVIVTKKKIEDDCKSLHINAFSESNVPLIQDAP